MKCGRIIPGWWYPGNSFVWAMGIRQRSVEVYMVKSSPHKIHPTRTVISGKHIPLSSIISCMSNETRGRKCGTVHGESKPTVSTSYRTGNKFLSHHNHVLNCINKGTHQRSAEVYKWKSSPQSTCTDDLCRSTPSFSNKIWLPKRDIKSPTSDHVLHPRE